MAKTRQQKEKTVVTLIDKFNRAKSVIFADYKGMTTLQLNNLRMKLKEQDAELLITKNTLLNIALEKSKIQSPRQRRGSPKAAKSKTLQGQTATIYAYNDNITPMKTIVKAIKDYQKGSIKSGFLGIDFLDPTSIVHLALLPSKLELQGKVAGLLLAPLSGMVGVLNANLRNLVYALDRLRRQRGGE